MSLLEKAAKGIAKSAGKSVAKKVALNVAVKASNKIEAVGKERNQKLFDDQIGTNNLILRQKNYKWKDKLDVYDENQKVRYCIKGEFTSIKHHRHIYDSSGVELGVIKEKLISLRSPLSLESNPVDFIFEIDGKKVGMLKSRWAFGGEKFEVDFNGWQIKGNVMGSQYKIVSGDTVITSITERFFLETDTYVINIPEPQNELIVLMIVVALDSSHSSKSRDLINTLERKTRYI